MADNTESRIWQFLDRLKPDGQSDLNKRIEGCHVVALDWNCVLWLKNIRRVWHDINLLEESWGLCHRHGCRLLVVWVHTLIKHGPENLPVKLLGVIFGIGEFSQKIDQLDHTKHDVIDMWVLIGLFCLNVLHNGCQFRKAICEKMSCYGVG